MKIKNYNIRLVDGFLIRNTLDDDFGIFHASSDNASFFSSKFYIPKGEWWLDYWLQNEVHFLIRVEEVVFPKSIKTYREERAYLKKTLCLKPPIPSFALSRNKIQDVSVVSVDGLLVRNYLDPEFIFGGHDLVYSYIPKDEIWIDARMDPKEAPYVVLHEMVERRFMEKGCSYEIAHEYATAADKEKKRLDGIGFYPGDPKYPWRGLSNRELIKKYYVSRDKQKSTKQSSGSTRK